MNAKLARQVFDLLRLTMVVAFVFLAVGLPPALGQSADREAATNVPTKQELREQILSTVDPSLFVGQDIEIEQVGSDIILKGPKDAVDAFVRLLEMVDDTERKDIEIVIVKQKDANEIAQSVQQAFNDAMASPTRLTEDELSITALNSKVLLVAALPEEMDRVLGLIELVDETETEGLGDVKILNFTVKYRKATEVAEKLQEFITELREKRGISGAEGELQITPNNANNTITVIAPESERETIQSLIDTIDVEPAKDWSQLKLTIFPLLHSEANELAGTIEELIDTQEGSGNTEEALYRSLVVNKAGADGLITELPPIDLDMPLRILPNDDTNSLIVATADENVEPMGELIRLLDGVPMGVDFSVRLFPLRFASADSLATTLEDMFTEARDVPEDPDGSGSDGVPESGVGKALVHNIAISADERTNTLIVSGRPDQLMLVESVITELDQPAVAHKFPVDIVPLHNTEVTRIAKIIEELFDQRFEAAQSTGADSSALERERLYMTVDIRANAIIVSATQENVAEIRQIVSQLDTKPATSFDQIHIIPCTRLTAADLKEKIEELWQRKADLRSEAEQFQDEPVIVVDERSNALVVAASHEDYTEIAKLVATLEAQPKIDDTQLFELRYADATVMSEMLDELFQGLESASEDFQAPTIIPDPRSNALVVAASRDAMERVAEVLTRLDVEAGPQTATFEVYALAHTSAVKMSERMTELFDSRESGSDNAGTPIVILPVESSNSLVCSASRDDHTVIVDLLSLLDKPSEIAKQFKIFPLKLARADAVAENLSSLFESQGSSSTGRADAIAVEAYERTNSLIVWASPSEMTNVEEMVGRLDSAEVGREMEVKVIQLHQALAEDFADQLQEVVIGDGGDDEPALIVAFDETLADGTKRSRRMLRQDIKVQADVRTNSLMVMAPKQSIEMIEALIKDYDRIRPIQSEIRLFPLINSDAETMVEQLTDVFEPSDDGEVRNQLFFGDGTMGEMDLASVGQTLRFAADTRTNTLIAAGAEIDLRMAADLISYLDSQDADDRKVEVYQAKYLDADKLADTVQSFVEDEQQPFQDIEGDEALSLRAERHVSVTSMTGGEEDEGSSTLLIGCGRRAYQRTMDMINQLDRPEPQVNLSVLIVEVQLNDSVDLGVEIAGQDLNFSENAILGPNGIVQGSDFDWITGTDLGAAGAGLGGFNFTVTGEDFGFLVRALQTDSRAEVLSRPVLMVRNGDEGEIRIADQIPVPTGSSLASGQSQTTWDYKNAGIVLTATPHISPDGYVTIEFHQEISNFSGESVGMTEGITAPIITERTVDTMITIRDGETVVVGGLIQTRDSEGESKVPVLGDLPLVGPLFRTTSATKSRTELLVILTADVLVSDEDIRHASEYQRDSYALPDSVLTNPLMEGLRILPHEAGLGPEVDDGFGPSEAPPTNQPYRSDDRGLYGPRPRTYGPHVPRTPASSTTTTDVGILTESVAELGPLYRR